MILRSFPTQTTDSMISQSCSHIWYVVPEPFVNSFNSFFLDLLVLLVSRKSCGKAFGLQTLVKALPLANSDRALCACPADGVWVPAESQPEADQS